MELIGMHHADNSANDLKGNIRGRAVIGHGVIAHLLLSLAKHIKIRPSDTPLPMWSAALGAAWRSSLPSLQLLKQADDDDDGLKILRPEYYRRRPTCRQLRQA
jgi:hypothetical protein